MADTLLHRLNATASLHCTELEGNRIVWRSWGAGPPLVLLHGSAGSWTHWLRNIEPLADRYRVHVPDLPGFGDSSAYSGPPTLASLAASLIASYRQLENAAPFTLAGFSFGSIVAESVALAHPDLVRALILVRGRYDATSPAPPAGLKRWRGLDPDQLEVAQRHNLATLMFHDAANIDAQALHLQIDNARRATLDPTPFFASRPPNALAQIRVPITAIAGQFDCYASGADRDTQQRSLLDANSRASYFTVEGAGHWVNYEGEAAFNRIMLASLERMTTL
ncbi:MAG: alpha/beta hydrolase [Massilia sp.]|nr:alpha/beta hydrolase [Massilia sp.]MDB5950308.1 alpha/beta hydrolase [Massilia sp.]